MAGLFARAASGRGLKDGVSAALPTVNWAGNYTYQAKHIHRPGSVEEVRRIVRAARRVKALGTRHSFNGIADTPGDLVVLDGLPRDRHLDEHRQCVRIGGGVRYADLGEYLHSRGWALANLASLPHISVAGACATATHGSGDKNGVLSTAVRAVEFVAAHGELITLERERHPDQFPGAVVSLGALGIVTGLVLDVVPAFSVRQDVYDKVSLDEVAANFDAVFAAGYSVSLFTDWSGLCGRLWVKRRVEPEKERSGGAGTPPAPPPLPLRGAVRLERQVHPAPGHPPENCTQQGGVPGPWWDRLPHFRMGFTPSSGEELQSEYFVPRQHAAAALQAIRRLGHRIAPLLYISEVRTIAADPLWLSPCYERPSVGIHFTWKRDWDAVRQVLPLIEEALIPFGVRPHWGKLFTLPPEYVRAQYPKLKEFVALSQEFDPDGKFRNAFLDTYVYGSE